VSRFLVLAAFALASACGAAGPGVAAPIALEVSTLDSGTGGSDPTDPSDAGLSEEPPAPVDPAACDCSTSADEPIELHVLARDLTRERMDALAALLAEDGFEIAFVEYADESSAPKVAIQAAPSRFTAVFGGRIEAHVEAMSSRDGFSCRLEVEGAVIPKRYRKLVRAVRTPDPQLY
jgi:hypothetical protein